MARRLTTKERDELEELMEVRDPNFLGPAFGVIALTALVALLLAGASSSANASAPTSTEDARKIALMSIAYHAPRVEVDLNYESEATKVLEKSGLLTHANPLQQRMFSLTEKGRERAAKDGWFVRYGKVSIAVGRFVVDPSTPIQQHQGGPWVTLTARVSFEENGNGKALLAIAPAESWYVRSFPDLGLTLNDNGHFTTVTIKAVCAEHANCNLLEH